MAGSPARTRLCLAVALSLAVLVEQGKCFKAPSSLRVTVGWRDLMSGKSQTVVFQRTVRIYGPARQYGKAFFYVSDRNVIEIKPLTTGVRAGELF